MKIADSCVCCGSRDLMGSPAVLMPFVAHRVFGWQPAIIDPSWHMRTLQCGMAYSVCKTLQCTRCHHLFLDMRFDDQEMEKLYRGYRGKDYTDLRDHYEPGYRSRNEDLLKGYGYIRDVEAFLRSYLPPRPAILDWGGASGINTPFKSTNELIHIHDISDEAPEGGVQRMPRSRLSETRYDLVVCSHVLEHIPYPVSTLREIHDVMSADSILYVELPSENIVRTSSNPERMHLSKKHWHEHVNFFTENSIRKLLELNRFQILDFKVLTVDGKSGDQVIQAACQKTR